MTAAAQPLPLLSAFLEQDEPSDDLALGRRAFGGDRAAFEALLRRSQGQVYGLCYRLLGERDAAKDAAQESFVRAWSALSSFDPTQRFDIWVLRIARNHCYDLLRRKGARPMADEEPLDPPDHSPSVLERMEQAEQSRDLEGALGQLPESDREVLSLYYVQRKKTREIAEVLGVAPGTIMARLFRAREKLRRMMTPAEVVP